MKRRSAEEKEVHPDVIQELMLRRQGARLNEFPEGCGVGTIDQAHLITLRQLCDTIIETLPAMVAWGDGLYDNKKRGFAMISESYWNDVEKFVAEGIRFHHEGADQDASEIVRKAAQDTHLHQTQ